MSDTGKDIYSLENYADKGDTVTAPLTKAAHRNPDIHQRGDTLPESLLEYQEGSATLNPDVAGNTPQMERSRQKIDGNNTVQNLTTTETQLGNLSLVVSCPPQAGGSPIVRLIYKVQVNGGFNGAALTPNFCRTAVYVNGIPHGGMDSAAYYQGNFTQGGIVWHVCEVCEIPINPGQTLTIDIRGSTSTAPPVIWDYTVSLIPDRSGIRAVLIY